jgi:hypothetical protein
LIVTFIINILQLDVEISSHIIFKSLSRMIITKTKKQKKIEPSVGLGLAFILLIHQIMSHQTMTGH